MEAIRALLHSLHAFGHDRLAETIAACPPDLLHGGPPGSTANPPAAAYAHAVFAEDQLVQRTLQEQPTVYDAGGWAARTGVAMPTEGQPISAEWVPRVQLDPATFAPYAAAVREATHDFIAHAPWEALSREIPLMDGETIPTHHLLASVIAFHTGFHTGEASALVGVAGRRGFPFL